MLWPEDQRNRQEAISIFSECMFCTSRSSSSCRYDALPLRQRNTSTQYCQCPILIYCLHHYHHPFLPSVFTVFLKMLEEQNDWLYGSLRRVRLEKFNQIKGIEKKLSKLHSLLLPEAQNSISQKMWINISLHELRNFYWWAWRKGVE